MSQNNPFPVVGKGAKAHVTLWWSTLLKNCPPAKGQEVSIRTFPPDNGPVKVDTVAYDTDAALDAMVDKTLKWSAFAKEKKATEGESWTVAPVPQVFNGGSNKADRANVNAAVCVFAEIDADPKKALQRLEDCLGPATMIVVSGGVWIEKKKKKRIQHDKLHVYWRLGTPLTSRDEIDRAWDVMMKIKQLADANDETPQLVHPMRAGGTLHLKTDETRPCYVREVRDVDVTLDALETALSGVTVPTTRNVGTSAGKPINKPSVSVRDCVQGIMDGYPLHQNITAITARLVAKGMDAADVHDLVDSLLDHSARSGDVARMDLARKKELPDAVRGAVQKFAQTEFKERTAGGHRVWNPFHEPTPATFPVDALPPVLAEYVETLARQFGGNKSAIAVSMLVTAAAALDARFRLHMTRHTRYMVPPIIWAFLSGASSTLKSPIMEAVTEALVALDNNNAQAYARDRAQWFKDNKGLPVAKRDPEPQWRQRFITNDGTLEGVAKILQAQDTGITIFADELAGLVGGFGQYKKGGDKDRADMLELYNAAPRSIDRATEGLSKTINVFGTCVLGGIQIDKLKTTDTLTIRDGFMARFIPVMMEATADGEDIPLPVSGSWSAICEVLTTSSPVELILGDDALAEMTSLRKWLKELHRLPNDEPALKDAFGKLDGMSGRIALVLHMMDQAVAELSQGGAFDPSWPFGLDVFSNSKPVDQLPKTVPVDVVNRAGRIVREFIVPSMTGFWATVAQSRQTDHTQKVAKYILTHRKSRYTMGEICKNVRGLNGMSHGQFDQVIRPLVFGDWLVPDTSTNRTEAWFVNEGIFAQFDAEAQKIRAENQKKRDLWKSINKQKD